MAKLDKFSKVNESLTIYRYENGWMVEIGGKDKKDDWKNSKLVCNTEAEVLALVQEYNTKELD